MKLDVNALRYLTKDDFRVLTAVEMGMRNVRSPKPCIPIFHLVTLHIICLRESVPDVWTDRSTRLSQLSLLTGSLD